MQAVLETDRRYAAAHDLLTERRLLAGVSGGVDSLVLADILMRLGQDLLGVHVNFRLRGEASDGDEAFVRDWCRNRGIPLIVRSFDTPAVAEASPGGGEGPSI
jgi:tRNA(Ile)-lysidine synthase